MAKLFKFNDHDGAETWRATITIDGDDVEFDAETQTAAINGLIDYLRRQIHNHIVFTECHQ